jgi:exonuclease SbcD
VTDDLFPKDCDYVALGHIHRPQRVNHRDDVRYSGSPIAMGFDERCDEKVVCIITFDGRKKTIETKHIPVFQRLTRVESDDINVIINDLKALAKSGESVWVEVNYTGDSAIRDLDSIVENVLRNTQVRCIHIKNASYVQQLLKDDFIETTELRELDPEYVFDMLLKQEKIEGEAADSLRATYKEALHAVHTSDECAHSSED